MASRFFVLGLLFGICLAADPSPLQDFCVTDSTSSVHLNGKVCKDPKLVQAEDFFFSGLDIAGNTSNTIGFLVTPATIPGANTLGIVIGRGDFAPNGFSPLHTHPRASEIVLVLEGRVEIGFVTSNPENHLFTKTLEVGDLFVVPKGLVHFQRNVGEANAVTITALSSQAPGLIRVADASFGSDPRIPGDLLAKAFRIDENTERQIQRRFSIDRKDYEKFY
ncbi:Germin-like protein subfamily 1 member 7 [Capsicum baccatum]|uniref:Germin-like protein n=1 Tax=Capsicum baccatum TaxID=33114 RepID=A0A2G2XDL6_CAPBA|nr:Germin-like protein subfamily 1 member 7 [Capsicum baccatum]